MVTTQWVIHKELVVCLCHINKIKNNIKNNTHGTGLMLVLQQFSQTHEVIESDWGKVTNA